MIKKIENLLSLLFLSFYIISVILTTVLFVPKYGNTDNYISSTKYYPITQNIAKEKVDRDILTLRLHIDIAQWSIIFVAETAIFLIPSILFYKKIRG